MRGVQSRVRRGVCHAIGRRHRVLCSTGNARPGAGAGDAWHVEFEEGRSVARAQDKDLLIDFGGSDWCLPCRWLKERILSRPEFIERGSQEFVLVDIDLPYRTPIPADRKQRYEELQRRYGINSFPSVVLALPDGRRMRGRRTGRRSRRPRRTGITSSPCTSAAGGIGRSGNAVRVSRAMSERTLSPKGSASSIRDSCRGSTPTIWPRSAKSTHRIRPATSHSSRAARLSIDSSPAWTSSRPRSTPRRLTR